MNPRDEVLVMKRQLLGLHRQTGVLIRACERVLGALAKEPAGEPISDYSREIRSVLDALNGICKKNFSAENQETVLLISRRLAEGYSVEDLKKVIRTCFDAWGRDPKMRIYLRPTTLFGEQFESYYQAAVAESSGLSTIEEKLKRQFQEV